MPTSCPYCDHALAAYGSRTDCPQCGREVFQVACPSCGRRTLNLTLLPRHGKVPCFHCYAVLEQLPGMPAQAVAAPAATRLSSYTPRAPKPPTLPALHEARTKLEESLLGLERAAQDRDLLRAPELRLILQHYLDRVQDALDWDAQCEDGEVTEAWLRDPEHLAEVDRLCTQPFWTVQMAMLPITTQSWALAVDDAARRWQYARRQWLTDIFDLTVMPILPGVTPFDDTYHRGSAPGESISEVISPGYLLRGVVLRKAWVRTGG